MTATLVKSSCRNCNSHLEFEAPRAGETIPCPHCGLETQLYIPGHAKPPMVQGKIAPRPSGNVRRVLGIVLLCIFGLILAGFLFYAVESSPIVTALGSGLIGFVIFIAVLVWGLLWILFPVFVYFALQHIKKTLDQIERNTRL